MRYLNTLAVVLLSGMMAQAQSPHALTKIQYYNSTYDGFEKAGTVEYMYSGGRGGDLDNQSLKYDTAKHYDVTGKLWKTFYQEFDGDNNIMLHGSYRFITKYEYDANGNITSHRDSFLLNNSPSGYGIQQWEYTYNSGSKLTSEEYYYYNSFKNDTIERKRTLKVYDPQDSLTSSTDEVWNKTSYSWIPKARELRTYNGNHYLVSLEKQIWNNVTFSWIPKTREQRTYNANDNLVSLEIANYDGGWVLLYGFYYYYDTGNKLDFVTTVDAINSSVKNDTVYYRYPNTNTVVNEYVKYYSNGTLWDRSKDSVVTNTNGTERKRHFSVWSTTSNVWEPARKTIITYNSFGSILDSVVQGYYNGKFTNSERLHNEYNSAGQLTHTNTNMGYNEQTQEWRIAPCYTGGMPPDKCDVQTKYYYGFPTNVNETASKAASLKIYPVPAKDELNITIPISKDGEISIVISDMQGKTLIHQQIESGEHFTVSTSALANGIYIINVTTPDERYTRQFNVVK